MSTADLFALLPLITLSSVILILMMVIAFVRNLALTCVISALGLLLTLASVIEVNLNLTSGLVTPLIVTIKRPQAPVGWARKSA